MDYRKARRGIWKEGLKESPAEYKRRHAQPDNGKTAVAEAAEVVPIVEPETSKGWVSRIWKS